MTKCLNCAGEGEFECVPDCAGHCSVCRGHSTICRSCEGEGYIDDKEDEWLAKEQLAA